MLSKHAKPSVKAALIAAMFLRAGNVTIVIRSVIREIWKISHMRFPNNLPLSTAMISAAGIKRLRNSTKMRMSAVSLFLTGKNSAFLPSKSYRGCANAKADSVAMCNLHDIDGLNIQAPYYFQECRAKYRVRVPDSRAFLSTLIKCSVSNFSKLSCV